MDSSLKKGMGFVLSTLEKVRRLEEKFGYLHDIVVVAEMMHSDNGNGEAGGSYDADDRQGCLGHPDTLEEGVSLVGGDNVRGRRSVGHLLETCCKWSILRYVPSSETFKDSASPVHEVGVNGY